MNTQQNPTNQPSTTLLTHLTPDFLRNLPAKWIPLAVALSLCDLEPARALLEACYSKVKRRPPYDPVLLLRALLAMLLLRSHSLNKWAKTLRKEPDLAFLIGFTEGSPAVDTFYSFVYRLLDGPNAPPRPSRSYRTRHFFRIHKEPKEKKNLSADLVERETALEGERLSDRLARILDSQEKLPLAEDFASRLQTIFTRCALRPSLEWGVLPTTLDAAVDGSLLDSQAAPEGIRPQPLPPGASQGAAPPSAAEATSLPASSEPPPGKYYSDPTASWAYCKSKDRYVFGYRIHAMMHYTGEEDLPLSVEVATGRVTDLQMGLEAQSRLERSIRQERLSLTIAAMIADKGYDAGAYYAFQVRRGIVPIIPLRGEVHRDEENRPRNEQGIPLCPAGLAMRLHGYQQRGMQNVYNCPVKRPGREQGKPVWRHYPEECPHKVLCEPESKMGPLVHLHVKDNPRLNPPLSRDSEEWKAKYKKRSGCERFNSRLKEILGARPYRREPILALVSMVAGLSFHVISWIRKLFGREAKEEVMREWLVKVYSPA